MLHLFLSLSFLLSNCAKDETISGYVDSNIEFHLSEFNGRPFGATASIRFPEQGRVTGKAPCNTYAASQSAPLPWLEIGPIRSTRATCDDLVFEIEFFDALTRMNLIETHGEVVILRNEAGEELVFRTRP